LCSYFSPFHISTVVTWCGLWLVPSRSLMTTIGKWNNSILCVKLQRLIGLFRHVLSLKLIIIISHFYVYFVAATWVERFFSVPTAAATVELPIWQIVLVMVLLVVVTARTEEVTWALTCPVPRSGITILLLWVTLVSNSCVRCYFHSDVVEPLYDTPDYSLEIDFWVTIVIFNSLTQKKRPQCFLIILSNSVCEVVDKWRKGDLLINNMNLVKE